MDDMREALKTSLAEYYQARQVALSDRTRYIGASDVAQCPRRALYHKFVPQGMIPRFLLGYFVEDAIASLLKGKRGVEKEICPGIKVHPDVVNKHGVWEIKYSDTPEVRESHLAQLNFQLGALKVKKGAIVLVSSREIIVQPWEFSRELYTGQLKKAIQMRDALFEINENPDKYREIIDTLPRETEMCSFCGMIKDCFHITETIPIEIPVDLIQEVKEKTARLEKIKDEAKDLLEKIGVNRAVTLNNLSLILTERKMKKVNSPYVESLPEEIKASLFIEEPVKSLRIGGVKG